MQYQHRDDASAVCCAVACLVVYIVYCRVNRAVSHTVHCSAHYVVNSRSLLKVLHAQSIVQIIVQSILQSICRPKIIQFEHLVVNLVADQVVNLVAG